MYSSLSPFGVPMCEMAFPGSDSWWSRHLNLEPARGMQWTSVPFGGWCCRSAPWFQTLCLCMHLFRLEMLSLPAQWLKPRYLGPYSSSPIPTVFLLSRPPISHSTKSLCTLCHSHEVVSTSWGKNFFLRILSYHPYFSIPPTPQHLTRNT